MAFQIFLGRTTGDCEMVRFHRHYVEYRRVGFKPLAAFHFAWMVVVEGARPLTLRSDRR